MSASSAPWLTVLVAGTAGAPLRHTVVHVDAIPLVEFDAGPGLIAPSALVLTAPMPARVVLCFFPELVAALPRTHRARQIGQFSAETGGGPIYAVGDPPNAVAVAHPGMGAPLAAHHLEQLIASGGQSFIVCGAAGALQPELVLGQVVIPTSAVRDEGTSYHYAAPAFSVEADDSYASAAAVLTQLDIPHLTGRIWTTDASFRETAERAARRRRAGCLLVEMEAAALMTVARFRSVSLAYYLYAGDSLGNNEWHHRGWTSSDRRVDLLRAALVAAQAVPIEAW